MKRFLWLFALLLSIGQMAWAWEGSGTASSPYLVKSSADWRQLAADVAAGNSYSGMFFEMKADIDAQGVSVGTESKPFSGTFDGYNHKLTFNRGVKNADPSLSVNVDKKISIADVTKLVDMILGKVEVNDPADVNDDESVTISDVTRLVDIILGIDNSEDI